MMSDHAPIASHSDTKMEVLFVVRICVCEGAEEEEE